MNKTLEKLKLKASASFSDKIRMPSVKSIHKMLQDLNIDCNFDEKTNVVEYKSAGNRYVNSRHYGKKGYCLTIIVDDDERDYVGTYLIKLDTSSSYYSWNTNYYACQIVKLLKIRKKIQ